MNKAYKQEIMNRLDEKVERMMAQIGDNSPHAAGKDGKYDNMPHSWWTSGFWPGLLWLMHDVTGKDSFKDAAWDWDKKLAVGFSEYPNPMHHDVGFQFLPTSVIKHAITGDEDGLRIGLEAANFLAGRFNPVGNFIRAWNQWGEKDNTGWAIIDCLMNTPLLYWASDVTGDPRYKHIAMKHTDSVLEYAIRDDGSVCHILAFNPETGEFVEQIGGQGYSGTSAWSRGNSWALHGLAVAYRYTGEQRYLDAAKRIAHYFIAALPDDHVPYWDFRLPSLDGQPRDSSAAACAASGLIELAQGVPADEQGMYMAAAERILYSLSENYATWDKPDHQGILLEATAHKPANSHINVSLIYGDYYFAEAFAKLNGWERRIF
ncbi:glycoside hydrolase family 88 protein [Paenibacillus sp. J5C_2022]|uniref:glycoside hydrolase family 88 protein n=1 Tax=Paenibacillus sp. J5C2022 TaxID=2977129 RepID=UPI0021CEAFFA|nr:glycoside hydrolase family 88 protein [Paenibacillus sp. J5C2022]MCU6709511.1 glycoside hydrolase family 88 protein [Paenibacillus sp. J5C2022]